MTCSGCHVANHAAQDCPHAAAIEAYFARRRNVQTATHLHHPEAVKLLGVADSQGGAVAPASSEPPTCPAFVISSASSTSSSPSGYLHFVPILIHGHRTSALLDTGASALELAVGNPTQLAPHGSAFSTPGDSVCQRGIIDTSSYCQCLHQTSQPQH